jgi:hypothetical protein
MCTITLVQTEVELHSIGQTVFPDVVAQRLYRPTVILDCNELVRLRQLREQSRAAAAVDADLDDVARVDVAGLGEMNPLRPKDTSPTWRRVPPLVRRHSR